MTSEKKERRNVDDASRTSVGRRLRSVFGKILPISNVSMGSRVRLLNQLVGDIDELESLVVGEQDATRERELSAAFESQQEGRVGKLLPPFGFAKPIQTPPDPSTDWAALAYHHVRHANMALESEDDVAFWREFYAARRMELFGLEKLGEEYLEMQAHSISLEAAGLAARDGLLRLDQPRRQAILDKLDDVGVTETTDEASESEGTRQLSANQVGAAMDVLHEFYVDQRLKGRILKRNLQSFIVIMALSAITFIVAFLTVSAQGGQGVPDRIALLQAPVSNLVGLSTVAQLIVLVLIVVVGIMGASVSGILSISRQLQRSHIPEQAGTGWFAAARLATGGVGALMVFLFLLSGIVSIGGDSSTGVLALNLGTDLTLALVFSLSFVAGFSERLLVRVVESIAGEGADVPRTAGEGY